MTSPDPTLPPDREWTADEPPRPRFGRVAREVLGLLLMVIGLLGLVVIAYDVDSRLAAAAGAASVALIGWRLTVAEE